MEFLIFLFLVLVGYIVIRYRETTFPLIKKALVDLRSDFEKIKTETVKKAAGEGVPYQPKAYFFTKSELEFFRILNSQLDAHRYTIFPKVRMADIVEVEKTAKKNWVAWNSIKAKHVDYLIWDLVENRIAMALELDGKSHNTIKMQKSDELKDRIFAKTGLPFARVRVGSDFASEIAKIVVQL
jgi:hypothetical protein